MPATVLTPSVLAKLERVVCGRYDIEVAPNVLVCVRELPGKAVTMAGVVDGTLCIVVDRDKPNSMCHARQFLREALAALTVGVADPFGLPIGEPDPDSHCRLRVDSAPADGVPAPRAG